MSLDSLHDLYVDELKDIHSAERQLLRALPRMAKAADSPELRSAFESHLKETEKQVERLDKIFAELEKKATGKKCKGMEGLIEEGKEMMEEEADPAVMDAALIAAAQRVEHYEMAAYGTAREFAERLGMAEAARLLQKTLEEEEQTDKLLTSIAEGGVNDEAESVAAD